MKQCPICGAPWVTYADGSSDCVDHCNGLGKVGKRWRRAEQRERQAAHDAYEAIRQAHAGGLPETVIARLVSVDRMTVRRALGKMR